MKLLLNIQNMRYQFHFHSISPFFICTGTEARQKDGLSIYQFLKRQKSPTIKGGPVFSAKMFLESFKVILSYFMQD